MEMYRTHMRNGLYFLHEHPAQARSWKDDNIARVMSRTDVKTVGGDMCRFGMQMQDEDGELKAVNTRTKFMTNAPEVAARLNRMCTKDHQHTRLEGAEEQMTLNHTPTSSVEK